MFYNKNDNMIEDVEENTKELKVRKLPGVNQNIIGWVSTKGLKKFNRLTSQFEEIEENELGA